MSRLLSISPTAPSVVNCFPTFPCLSKGPPISSAVPPAARINFKLMWCTAIVVSLRLLVENHPRAGEALWQNSELLKGVSPALPSSVNCLPTLPPSVKACPTFSKTSPAQSGGSDQVLDLEGGKDEHKPIPANCAIHSKRLG